MFTQKGAWNIPHLPPDSLFCLSKVGSVGAVGNKDQRAKVLAVSAFPPWTLCCWAFPAHSVTLEGLQLLQAGCRCRIGDDEGEFVSPILVMQKSLGRRDRHCRPHRGPDVWSGTTIPLCHPMFSTKLGYGYPRKVNKQFNWARKKKTK